jgi:hypothetical protein
MPSVARWVTPERLAFLKHQYVTNPSREAIEVGLRAIPGPDVPDSWAIVRKWCANHGMIRPVEAIKADMVGRVYVKREKPAGDGKMRHCLKCRREFLSPGRYIFRCSSCLDYTP